MSTDTRPLITLERNNAGALFVGLTEFDSETGFGVRACVLVHQTENVADAVIRRRFDDIVRLAGSNARSEVRA